ncbi:2OG-Fe(II) oxygenase [Roseateles sp.]|uniref:2OG-Fe(II) oxygenase n=1 Tax=Roseateles sp. TaxID=1971397 RepID=UPI0039E91682
MTSIDTAVDHLDWVDIGGQLDVEGWAVLPGLLGPDAVRDLAQQARASGTGWERLEFSDLGCGELRYFDTNFPIPLTALRSALYRRLAVIANRWNETLDVAHRYPTSLDEFLQLNRAAGQTRPQSHLTRLGVEDHLALHQRSDGEQVFPLQLVALLSEPGDDFDGGEFVMTEQRPRMQSRPAVLPLRLGDLAVIATAHRPFKGSRGHYRVNLKHAVSRVRRGQRIGLELSFHDAP